MCYRTTFDQGFKNTGGVGMWLDYLYMYAVPMEFVSDPYVLSRFFFDDLFCIVILIFMMDIVLGLMLDTFTILGNAEDKSRQDRENKCFICGKEKEEIERLTGRPFQFHTLKEHNEWMYLYYIAYLKHKETNEYSGIESYISQLVENNEVDWIPQQQGLFFKQQELKGENDLMAQIKSVTTEINQCHKELHQTRKEIRN